MTDTLKTRNLIVTLPNVTGAEADEILTCIQDSLAPLVDDPRADHALGETQSPAVHVSPNREGVDLRLASGWNIADVPNSGPGCFLTPYEARQLAGALLAIPGVADAEPPKPPTHKAYYTSADLDATTWSVYSEEYANVHDDEPIDGTQRQVATVPDEAAADHLANWLYERERQS